MAGRAEPLGPWPCDDAPCEPEPEAWDDDPEDCELAPASCEEAPWLSAVLPWLCEAPPCDTACDEAAPCDAPEPSAAEPLPLELEALVVSLAEALDTVLASLTPEPLADPELAL